MPFSGKARNFAFFLVLTIAIALRLFRLDSLPPALFSDENDIGYQAYIFDQCHTDYFGNFLPSRFHSFADWQPFGYIASVWATGKIFGYTDFAVRFPSVIFGVLSIAVFGLLVNQIFKKSSLALLAMFILTINPWHLHYSRTGFGVTGMLFFYLLSLLFLFRRQFPLFLIFLLSTTLFYSTALVTIILTIFITIIANFRQLLNLPSRQKIILGVILGLFGLTQLFDLISGKSGFRFNYISIFTDPTVSQQIDINRRDDAVVDFGEKIGLKTTLSTTFFHNKFFSWSTTFFQNYIASFSTDFLFGAGDINLRHHVTGVGYFYFIDFILLLIGLVTFKKIPKILLWFLLAIPIPFALTRDSTSPHGTRLFLMIPFIILIIVSGIDIVLIKLHKKLNFILQISLYLTYFISLLFFYHQYIYHYPQRSAKDWHVGIKEAILAIQKIPHNKVFFSNQSESFVPFFLFQTHYLPPQKNCNITGHFEKVSLPGIEGSSLDSKTYFVNVEWRDLSPNQTNLDQSLFVVNQLDLERLRLLDQTPDKRYNFYIEQEITTPFKMVPIHYIIRLTKKN